MKRQGSEHLHPAVASLLRLFNLSRHRADQFELLFEQRSQRGGFVSSEGLDLVGEMFFLSRLDVPRQVGDFAIGMIDRRDELARGNRRLGSEGTQRSRQLVRIAE